ncbi:hypothetical protein LTR84_010994 [Exophiala bonariae]|uniref:endo-1,3(4)-beta-glucanase n=1 Tax=Exophiala bonariae TaxID=1690606 RepID=A0AAV9NHZ7_9EURO|nr:hypothetical protein LTR84_010994 [Exophiala bonariae]
MLSSTFLISLAGLIRFSAAGYVLQDDYSIDKFFAMFEFFTAPDPTNGYVTYVGQSAAQAAGLVNTNNNAIYMGVDHTNVASGSGRQSVRLTSKKSYTHGLIILDASHMPGGICGTWPAFWTVGPNWPQGGEIDIIEGVNSQVSNSMALHTNQGCSITNTGLFSGTISTPNCDVNAAGQANSAGCGILMSNSASYGTGFNQGQGGVYATEWTSDHISIWFFPRSAIPMDISSGSPNPGNWGQPAARFGGGCKIDNFFSNHQIVFDTTFCGDWAANVWTTDPVCSSKAPTCQSFVQNNPSAFKDAFWSINSLKVYQSPDAGNFPHSPDPNQGPTATSWGPPITAATAGPYPAPSDFSGKPSGPLSQSFGPGSEAAPSTGFSRGGNGRHTKSFGGGSWNGGGNRANFQASQTSVPGVSGATETEDENTQFDPAVPETTPAPNAEELDRGGAQVDGNVDYVTVTALDHGYFEDDDHNSIDGTVNDKREASVEKKEALSSISPVEDGEPAEAETSKRDVVSELEKRAVDKASHLHLHRHNRRHTFFWGKEAGAAVEERRG